jgi:hypothetical protein
MIENKEVCIHIGVSKDCNNDFTKLFISQS